MKTKLDGGKGMKGWKIIEEDKEFDDFLYAIERLIGEEPELPDTIILSWNSGQYIIFKWDSEKNQWLYKSNL